MLNNYEKATDLIQKNVDLFVSGFCPCSECSIQKIEQVLNSKMPRDYVQFLRTFGLLNFGAEEVFGIFRDEIDEIYVGNMITWTLEARNKWGMPKNLVIIHELGDGTRDCLQINENDPDKSPVVEYHDPDSPVRILAPDFGTFLLDLVQEEIKYQEEEKQKEVAKAPQEKVIQDELF